MDVIAYVANDDSKIFWYPVTDHQRLVNVRDDMIVWSSDPEAVVQYMGWNRRRVVFSNCGNDLKNVNYADHIIMDSSDPELFDVARSGEKVCVRDNSGCSKLKESGIEVSNSVWVIGGEFILQGFWYLEFNPKKCADLLGRRGKRWRKAEKNGTIPWDMLQELMFYIVAPAIHNHTNFRVDCKGWDRNNVWFLLVDAIKVGEFLGVDFGEKYLALMRECKSFVPGLLRSDNRGAVDFGLVVARVTKMRMKCSI